MRRAAALNIVKWWLLVAILGALFGAIGWALDGPRAATLFVFCAVLAALAVYAYGDRALLGMLGAREYALAEDPLLRSTVDALAAKLGVAPPKLYLIPDLYPRALAAGRGPMGGAIAVSMGLLGALRPAELEAVLAHELAHVRRRDVLVQTAAVMVAVVLVDLSRIGGWFERALRAVLAPIASAFVHLLLSPRRDLAADRAAAEATSPEALSSALLKLDTASDLVTFEASPATAPLYTVNPFAEEGLAALFVTQPPLEKRRAALAALLE